MEQLKQQLQAAGILYKENEPLSVHCTFRIGGPADLFVMPRDEDQLCQTVQFCKQAEIRYYPGTVGGAVYMNAGAYGGEMKDVLEAVSYLTADGRWVDSEASELDFSYRHSAFEENDACILGAVFHLEKGDPDAIKARMNELMQKRIDKQPLDKPSAGSTFKRPAGAFAAALIDQCGLRGYRHGGAAVSDKHCGFVVNLGGATCADVLALCDEVRAIVKEKTGYDLEKEIRVVK